MGMIIDALITYCEEKEHNHRLSCKRYDDASGYTRSKDKNIRTASAVIEEQDADLYKEIADTMRKYQKIRLIINKWNAGIYDDEGLCDVEVLEMLSDEVVEDGNDN